MNETSASSHGRLAIRVLVAIALVLCPVTAMRGQATDRGPKSNSSKDADQLTENRPPVFRIPQAAIDAAKSTAQAELARRGDLKSRRPTGLEDVDSPEGLQRAIQVAVEDLADLTRYQSALTQLTYIGEPAFEALVKGLNSHDNQQIRWCVSLLENHGERAIEPLAKMMKTHPDAGIRLDAVLALGNTLSPSAVEPLIAALDDESSSVKHMAAVKLAHFRDERVVEPLNVLGNDPDFHQVAEESLGYIRNGNGPSHWPPELMELRSVTVNAKTLAGERYGKAEIELLRKHISSDNAWVAVQCVHALANLDVRSAVPDIIRTGPHRSKFSVLAQFGTTEAVDYLVDCLSSDDRTTRQLAMEGLGSAAGRWPAPLLVALLDDATLKSAPREQSQPIDLFDGNWPQQHTAYIALAQTLSSNGLQSRTINLASGNRPPELQTELDRVKQWWHEHGSAYLRGEDVPNPVLLMVMLVT